MYRALKSFTEATDFERKFGVVGEHPVAVEAAAEALAVDVSGERMLA